MVAQQSIPRKGTNVAQRRKAKSARNAELTDEQKLDPVEWVKFYWEQQNDADPYPFLAMSSILRLHQLMTSVLDQELKQGFEMSLTDYLMLKTLQMSDTGTRLLSRVAWHLLVHATTVTIATDRLEARGLLVREAHPRDRRATLVTITDEGRELVNAATEALAKADYGLPGLTPEKATELVKFIAPIRRAAGDQDRAHGTASSSGAA
ncbi:MAG: MarR family winged helix-turn-helix transcriptional regulator [Sciscionella sp.]